MLTKTDEICNQMKNSHSNKSINKIKADTFALIRHFVSFNLVAGENFSPLNRNFNQQSQKAP